MLPDPDARGCNTSSGVGPTLPNCCVGVALHLALALLLDLTFNSQPLHNAAKSSSSGVAKAVAPI
jgi:hypothetical protein